MCILSGRLVFIDVKMKLPPQTPLQSMAPAFFPCGDAKFITTKGIATVSTSDALLAVELENLAPRPVTVLCSTDNVVVDSNWLNAKKSQMLVDDDVFNEGFFKHILICNASERSVEIQQSHLQRFEKWEASIYSVTTSHSVRAGPYFAMGSTLYQVSKLFDDPQGAFMFGVRVDDYDPQRHVLPSAFLLDYVSNGEI